MRISGSRSTGTVILATLTAMLIAGCGSKNADATADDSVAASADSAAPASAAVAAVSPATATAASLTADDIDKWQRGMEAEMKAVQDAGTQLKNAKTSDDSLNAVAAVNETATQPAGAKAAGVDERRYQLISQTFSSLTGDMAPIENEMDVSKMPADLLTTMKNGRANALAAASVGLPPELLDALRPRAAVLRKQALTLIAARLKAAGMAQ